MLSWEHWALCFLWTGWSFHVGRFPSTWGYLTCLARHGSTLMFFLDCLFVWCSPQIWDVFFSLFLRWRLVRVLARIRLEGVAPANATLKAGAMWLLHIFLFGSYMGLLFATEVFRLVLNSSCLAGCLFRGAACLEHCLTLKGEEATCIWEHIAKNSPVLVLALAFSVCVVVIVLSGSGFTVAILVYFFGKGTKTSLKHFLAPRYIRGFPHPGMCNGIKWWDICRYAVDLLIVDIFILVYQIYEKPLILE